MTWKVELESFISAYPGYTTLTFLDDIGSLQQILGASSVSPTTEALKLKRSLPQAIKHTIVIKCINLFEQHFSTYLQQISQYLFVSVNRRIREDSFKQIMRLCTFTCVNECARQMQVDVDNGTKHLNLDILMDGSGQVIQH